MIWVPTLVGALLAAGLTGTPVFSFDDPAITESSGLVDLGSTMVTTNDSGGDPLVFVLDQRGRTVGRTTFTSSVTDVEALAPAGPEEVWVGDIGDNNAVRSTVQVYRVGVGTGDRTVAAPRYDLAYPDGAHDAESLLYGTDGRLRIVTKGLLGGRVYTAPKHLDPNRVNRLRRGPEVSVWATDAALFPDGRHVIVRGYGDAMVATYPGFVPLDYVDLPAQEQGEGISIGSNGRIRLSSEGVGSAVLQVALPADVLAKLHPTNRVPVPSGAVDEPRSHVARDVGIGALVGGAAAFGWWLARRRRRSE